MYPDMLTCIIVCAALLLLDDVIGSDSGPPETGSTLSCNVTFEPSVLSVQETELLILNYTAACRLSHSVPDLGPPIGVHLQFWIADPDVATVEGNGSFLFRTDADPRIADDDLDPVTHSGSVRVRGVSFGKTLLHIRTWPNFADDDVTALSEQPLSYRLVVIKPNSVINIVFLAILGVMIVIYNFGFGCKIEWRLIVAIFKRPVAPAIGLCCQFLVMAPLAFGVSVLLHMSNESGLGLLAISAAPGGGGSNVFAYLLQADLELSITMSFISTIFALGMTPFWIWTLGRFFTKNAPEVKIPVSSVFSSLAVVTLPVMAGLILRRQRPEVGRRMASGLKPLTGVIATVFIGMGVYVYRPALAKVTWRSLLACLLVPLSGYGIGAGAGKLFGEPRSAWLTIALETGFQNLALSLMIVGTSLDQPESDLAGVVPICYMFLSSALATAAFLGTLFYRIWNGRGPCRKRTSDVADKSGTTADRERPALISDQCQSAEDDVDHVMDGTDLGRGSTDNALP